jgi:MOSC domain-containing protein YiiM
MERVSSALLVAGAGVEGDHKGLRFPNRGVTILALEDWSAAIAELTDLAGPVPLPWTMRRANILVRDVRLPRGRGSVLAIGAVRLEVTGQTTPCARMDEAHSGLRRALAPDWRGGVTCRVLAGGTISIGDGVRVLDARLDRNVVLPG